MDGPTQTHSALQLFGAFTRAVVRVLSGPSEGLKVELGPEPLLVGTSEEARLRISDPLVSRRHCELRLGPMGCLVTDLESRNGTWFGSTRVGELGVPPGTLLRVGNSYLTIEVVEGRHTKVSDTKSLLGLVGRSQAMRRVYALLNLAAQSDVTVLLQGETGTGKGLAARTLHQLSRRRASPFEVFDCGAVAASLLHSELFGHRAGAFTGADRDRPGVFERAHGGTVFIDEAGELPLDLQRALLRVTESSEVLPLGADRPVRVEARLVVATHRDLAAMVTQGRFREDLFYRLSVLPITLPSLQERIEDLPELCDAMLRELGVRDPGPIAGPNVERLRAAEWPGNLRQLRNVLEKAVVLAGGPAPFVSLAFELDSAGPAVDRTRSFQEQKQQAVASFERQFLVELLERTQNNIKQSSRESGIERTQLKRLLKKHNLI